MTDANDATGNTEAAVLIAAVEAGWDAAIAATKDDYRLDGTTTPIVDGIVAYHALLADRERLARDLNALRTFAQKVIDDCSKVRVLYEQEGFGTPEEYERLHDYAISSDALEIEAELLLAKLPESKTRPPDDE